MADGLSTKLQPYLSDFSLEFWLKIWHSYYLGDVRFISGEIRKSVFSSQYHFNLSGETIDSSKLRKFQIGDSKGKLVWVLNKEKSEYPSSNWQGPDQQ